MMQVPIWRIKNQDSRDTCTNSSISLSNNKNYGIQWRVKIYHGANKPCSSLKLATKKSRKCKLHEHDSSKEFYTWWKCKAERTALPFHELRTCHALEVASQLMCVFVLLKKW